MDVLYLGTRRYSSWSMRGWLAVRLAGLIVEEIVIPLAGGPTEALKGLTPNGQVPALRHAGHLIWESLAICEYCAELSPQLWPRDQGHRATARSMASEMHAGFQDLRRELPMSLFRSAPATRLSLAAAHDVARIDSLWQACSKQSPGPFLFGSDMTIADVMYAPIVTRFLSYKPPLSESSASYCRRIRASPLVQEWYDLAVAEPVEWRLPQYE